MNAQLKMALRFQDATHREQERAASVAALAESVVFAPRPIAIAADDDARIEDWFEEGGAFRS